MDLFWIGLVAFGIALIVNSARGLIKREYVFDERSAKEMDIGSLAGILIGALVLSAGVGFAMHFRPFN